jgi:hypothetical protein
MWNAFLFVGLMVIAHPPQPVKAPPTSLPAQTASQVVASETAATVAADAAKDAPAPVPARESLAPVPQEIDAP